MRVPCCSQILTNKSHYNWHILWWSSCLQWPKPLASGRFSDLWSASEIWMIPGLFCPQITISYFGPCSWAESWCETQWLEETDNVDGKECWFGGARGSLCLMEVCMILKNDSTADWVSCSFFLLQKGTWFHERSGVVSLMLNCFSWISHWIDEFCLCKW